MLVPLQDLDTFSKCSRFFNFAKTNPPVTDPDRRMSIFTEVLQQMYLFQLDGSKPTQRQIIGWVDKRVFKPLDVTNDEQMAKGLDLSESVLMPLRTWYEDYFLKEQLEGYINVPIDYTVKGHQIQAIVPLIKLSDPISILLVGNAVQSKFQLYNSLLGRGMALLVSKELKTPVVNLQYLYIGNREMTNIIELKCTEEMNRRTEEILTQIADSMAAGHNYPSFTPMCITCPYRKDCII